MKGVPAGFRLPDGVNGHAMRAATPRHAIEAAGPERFDGVPLGGSPSAPAYNITARPFTWRDPRTFPRRQWLYGRHLVRKFLSCTVAPGGVGKSSLQLVEAVAMVTGRPLLGVKISKPLTVWVINLEDPLEELERRVLAILLHFDIHPEELDGRLFLNSGRETKVVIATTTRNGTVLAQPVVDALRAEIKAKRADVVFIDPLVKAHQVPENDNGAVDMVCTAFAGIADECDCAFDLIHHVRKTNGAEVTVEDGRGAVALLAACRSARALNRMTKDEAEKVGIADPRTFFRAETGKGNLAPPEKAEWFELRSVSLGNGDPAAPFDNSDRVPRHDLDELRRGCNGCSPWFITVTLRVLTCAYVRLRTLARVTGARYMVRVGHGETTSGRMMNDQRRSLPVNETPAGRSATVDRRASPGSVFMRAFLSGLAAPVMAFTTTPRYVVMPPGASVPAAWRSVAQHVSAAFDEQHR